MNESSSSSATAGASAGEGVAPSRVTATVPMGPMERMASLVEERFEGDGTGLMAVHVRGCVEQAVIRRALSRLQLRHPKLRAGITGGQDGRRFFVLRDPPPPIPLVYKDGGDGVTPWQDEVRVALRAGFDRVAGPLARAHVVCDRAEGVSHILFVASHAIIDGVSMVQVLHDLLDYYEEAERGGEPAPVESLPMVVPPRARIAGSFFDRLRLIFRAVKNRKAWRGARQTTLPPASPTTPSPLWHTHIFTEEETVALNRRCRKEKTAVIGAHFAAAVRAMADVLPQPELHVRYRIPVNVRRWLSGPAGPVTEHDLGHFAASLGGVFTVDRAQSIWDVARWLRSHLRTFVTSGGPQAAYNASRLGGPALLKKKPRRVAISTNSLGELKTRRQYGSLMIEGCTMLPKDDHIGVSLRSLGLTVNGRFCMTIMGAGVAEDFWARYRDAMIGHLRAALIS